MSLTEWLLIVSSIIPQKAFELATGDYLFEPHSGEDYSRDEGEWICILLKFILNLNNLIQYI